MKWDHYGYPASRGDERLYDLSEPAAAVAPSHCEWSWFNNWSEYMDINDAFPSKYLKAGDLKGREVKVKVAGVTLEQMGDGEVKPVVSFEGKERGLVLNKINKEAIVANLGSSDTDDWTGKELTIFPTQTEFAGRTVPCLRVKLIIPLEEERPQMHPEDDIPF